MTEFHRFPITKILEHYGFEPIDTDKGGWQSIKCAFHGDRDASGSVNAEEGLYNCWSGDCPKGSATQVIMKMEGVSFDVAHRRAEEISGYRNDAVRGRRGGGTSVSGEARHYRSYREIRDAWSREESDTGT